MKTSLWIHGLLLLSLSSVIVAKKKNESGWITIDEEVKEEANQTLEEQSSGSGSGLCPDDEEGCLELSGSGFGEPTEWSTTSKVTEIITPRPLTSCEQLRNSAKVIQISKDSIFIPECLADGTYKKLQCNREKEERECWCVDLSGRQITGTYMKYPLLPDCEKGTNLPPCIYKMVQSSHGLLGEQRPRCNDNGEFEKQQCFAMDCWCVNKHGEEIDRTRKTIPAVPDCEEKMPLLPISTTVSSTTTSTAPKRTTKKHHGHHKHTTAKPDGVYIINQGEETKLDKDHIDEKIDVEIGKGKGDMDESKYDSEEDNYSAERSGKDATAAEQIMTQPGVLAAIIGGAVVGLLCAVLLVMFIVYRMRKKDEGSYALDEPKKYDNIAYTKAPDKEFYA